MTGKLLARGMARTAAAMGLAVATAGAASASGRLNEQICHWEAGRYNICLYITQTATVALLSHAGAGEAANPRILIGFATWCGIARYPPGAGRHRRRPQPKPDGRARPGAGRRDPGPHAL
jgi:hypothetical protein